MVSKDNIPIRKSWGQNFLTDNNTINKIIKIIDPKKTDTILEIGPGHGALTEKLLPVSKNLYAIGTGYWTRANNEVCILATKGKISRVKGSNVHRLVVADRERHSKKPAIIRDKIVELCGDLPRIELFARQRVEGWDCWGNEI